VKLSGNRPRDWVCYWDEITEGHLLFREEAREYVTNLASAVMLDRGTRVLEFGCGNGFVAEVLAPRVGQLFLWDAAASMRDRTRGLLVGRNNVHFLDLSGPADPPEDVRFDLILVNSVIQYMSGAEFAGWLSRWRSLLAPGGQILISDIITPGHSVLADIPSLLAFGVRRRYLFRILRSILGESTRYRTMQRACPLYRVSPNQLRRQAFATGLVVRLLPRNLTHLTNRITAVFCEARTTEGMS
jgi:SAM-dependent methyltransferase